MSDAWPHRPKTSRIQPLLIAPTATTLVQASKTPAGPLESLLIGLVFVLSFHSLFATQQPGISSYKQSGNQNEVQPSQGHINKAPPLLPCLAPLSLTPDAPATCAIFCPLRMPSFFPPQDLCTCHMFCLGVLQTFTWPVPSQHSGHLLPGTSNWLTCLPPR